MAEAAATGSAATGSAATGSAAAGTVDVLALRAIALLMIPMSSLDTERMHAIVKAKKRGPRPGEIHNEILQCDNCLKFMAYDKFHKSQWKWSLPARKCIVCKDACMGPRPSEQRKRDDYRNINALNLDPGMLTARKSE